MTTYYVEALITISIAKRIEAESEDGALKIASDLNLPSIMSCDNDNDHWDVDELDGEPFDINVAGEAES